MKLQDQGDQTALPRSVLATITGWTLEKHFLTALGAKNKQPQRIHRDWFSLRHCYAGEWYSEHLIHLGSAFLTA